MKIATPKYDQLLKASNEIYMALKYAPLDADPEYLDFLHGEQEYFRNLLKEEYDKLPESPL